MEKTKLLFLEIFRTALQGGSYIPVQEITEAQWEEIFTLAESHHVLPMVYEAAAGGPAADSRPAAVMRHKHAALQQVMLQTQKTGAFLKIYQALEKAGVRPLVVKGIVCRSLYPKPDLRFSSDEDLLVRPEEFPQVHAVLLEQGLEVLHPDTDIAAAHEVSYIRHKDVVYLEVHKTLFPPDEPAYGEWNRFFSDVYGRAEEICADGCRILTMAPTDHLFYLICHAFKHFLHSGVGIRQAADIALYANHYGERIDWDRILADCRKIRAEKFAAALFRIGEIYLTFDPAAAAYPDAWIRIETDEEPLLSDLLDAGVYGSSSMSRRHSSTMTLHAAAAQKHGNGQQAGRGSVLRSVFPPARELAGRYPYLQRRPYLLPAAWISRIWQYLRETAGAGYKPEEMKRDNSAALSVRIGKQRIGLLRIYGVLEGETDVEERTEDR